MTGLSAVLLDVGGTLWPDHFPPGAVDRRLDRLVQLGLSSEQAQRFLTRFTQAVAIAELAIDCDIQAVIAASAHDAGCESWTPAQLRGALCVPTVGLVDLFPGTHQLLSTIHRTGLRCAIVSNASVRAAADYRADFAAFGLDQFVDAFISSVDVCVRKPDPRIFETAMRALGCTAVQCIVIGNSERNDIQPAVRLGARTIRVAIEEPPPSRSSADFVTTSLDEVAAVLRTWTAGYRPTATAEYA